MDTTEKYNQNIMPKVSSEVSEEYEKRVQI